LKRKALWLTLSFLVIGAVVLASCGGGGQTTTTTSPVTTTGGATTAPLTTAAQSDKPQYGGTLTLATGMDVGTWDPCRNITGEIWGAYADSMWEGDWTKGPAGGYGQNLTDWGFGNNDIFEYKLGIIADSWKWSVSADGKTGTIVYTVRPGVKWHMVPNSAAAKLANGREVTADDVVYSFQRATTYSLAFVFNSNPGLRNAPITKTGPREVSITLPYNELYNGIIRFGDAVFIEPADVAQKFDMTDWHNQVGTGPFMVTDYVSGSMCTLDRSPNFWMKNPIGPGKGDQLPYLDKMKVMVVPDASTRLAALQTGKVDRIVPLFYDDAGQMRKNQPKLIEVKSTHWQGRGLPFFMRTDKPPFDNILVREAMNMAIDRDAINNSQFGGEGDRFPFPFAYVKEYDPIYYKPADWTPEIKEIYTYNPDKARQLLKDAGFPSGFKTELTTLQTDVDLASIYVEMWSKIGVTVEMKVVEGAIKMNMEYAWTHAPLIAETTGPLSIFMIGNSFYGIRYNLSTIKDPAIDKFLSDCREASITDLTKAMKIYRDMTIYALGQGVWHVPDVASPASMFYWPWLKNYDGEITIGYDDMSFMWYLWIDRDLKRQMGY